jgi:TetR/AcrR family transcriptional regulator, transcriptional repressor for nem operon
MMLSAEQQKMVLDGAVNLFARSHIRDITVDKLAKASGVSIFDIVRHYQSKDNILIAVLERELETMAAAANAPELRFPGETLKDELHLLADVILQEYRNRLPFLRKILIEALDNDEVGAVFYRTFIVQGRLLFAQFLNERKRLGELRENIDVEAAAAIFLAALTGALWTVEFFGGKQVEALDYERLSSQLSDVFLDGVKHR